MNHEKSVRAFLRSPQWMSSLAAFLLVWGLLSSRIAAALLGVCLFYLAWHVRRSQVSGGEGVHLDAAATLPVGRKKVQVSWLLLVSVGVGSAIGAIQVYARFLSLGWSRASATAAALLIAGGVGIGSWIMAKKIMTHQK